MSSTGEEIQRTSEQESHQLLLFSGNDYLGLSVHPAVRQAAAQVQYLSIRSLRLIKRILLKSFSEVRYLVRLQWSMGWGRERRH